MHIYRGIIAALSATLVLKVATVVPALILADIIDNISSSAAPTQLLLGAFIFLIALQASMTPLQAWCLARLCQDRVKQLSIRWCRALLDKRFEAYGQLHGGTLVKVLDRGITAQERWLGFLIGSAWPVLAEATVLITLFAYLGATSVLIGLIPLSLAYLWANDRLVRWRRPHIEAVNSREDELAEQWVDTFASAATVKLEKAEHAAMLPVNHTLSAYADSAVRVAHSGGWVQGLRTLFIGLGSGGLLMWGIQDQALTTPQLSLGELVALFTLVSGLLAGVAQLAEAWRLLDQFRLDKQKLEHWLRLPPFGPTCSAESKSHDNNAGLRIAPCLLSARNSVQLEIEEPLVLHKGERVALIGSSGCGKSTLLHALAGTVFQLREHVQLYGRCLAELDACAQFSRLRLCPQDAHFLPGPLPRAVLFEHDHDRAQIERWLERLGLDKDWYELDLDARAESISGGEARRLTLLRVLNQPGEFNFFDEPTAGLDAGSAERTWDLLFEAFQGRGLICVTHDQSALSRFDRVITLSEGRIVSQVQAKIAQNPELAGASHTLRDRL
ncbi:ATP-binding cassette domain-containing protein [Pseudomonas sp. M2]|uniref:ATP-binding cassette domain-containing protein n=1 Tax=Pseudomonas sp. M2 TaxID=228756 RepID=UPI0018C9649B|nr:ATP-binding cassette domain-containing protein [Pseudomonas sp. M2]MBG6126047.1 ATP-binding cassette subfamily B protein/ATP-binding cassette subfamily B protein RtxE/ATP-binding cassette subfamily C protein CydC [Pseudomonas sp. M2]HDS1745982.1 ATP-binding cassette domain-containing protein [Pseudomonas putida]